MSFCCYLVCYLCCARSLALASCVCVRCLLRVARNFISCVVVHTMYLVLYNVVPGTVQVQAD